MQFDSDSHQNPIDLKHLRDITDGEKEVEREIFQLFLQNAEECLMLLSRHCEDQISKTWQDVSDELKGASASLGAFRLSKLCHQAESASQASLHEKKIIIEEISKEIRVIKHFLKTVK